MSAWKIFILFVLTLGLSSRSLSFVAPPPQEGRPIVVLSPGHGWKQGEALDPGAVSGDLVEKDINLDVARHARDYLRRCDIEVHLTRTGDDPTHTLDDVAALVNDHQPTLGVSIHTNSGEGNPSGAEAWYTVGGYDDAASQALAAMLAGAIARHMDIPDRGAKPETSNPRGGLYIHDWQAPAALVEIGFLQGDADLLKDSRDEFGRAIAQAIVSYLGKALACGDAARQKGIAVATAFPGDEASVEISLLNDGLAAWNVDECKLDAAGGDCDAAPTHRLPAATAPGAVATWMPILEAPDRPGFYVQSWQLTRDGQPIDSKASAYLIVVPEEARELKQDFDDRIAEARREGEEALQDLIEDAQRRAIEWAKTELPDLICRQVSGLLTGALGIVLFRRVKRRR